MIDKNQVVDDLIAARDLILDPKDWCQGVYEMYEDGSTYPIGHLWYRSLRPRGRRVVSRCAMGALFEVVGMKNSVHIKLLAQAARSLSPEPVIPTNPNLRMGVPEINDCLGHGATMEMYDRAIRLAKELPE